MDGWIWIIVFLAVAVVYLVVGYIGNKVSDGIENGIRKKQMEKNGEASRSDGPQESLAARYRRSE